MQSLYSYNVISILLLQFFSYIWRSHLPLACFRSLFGKADVIADHLCIMRDAKSPMLKSYKPQQSLPSPKLPYASHVSTGQLQLLDVANFMRTFANTKKEKYTHMR
jgi:hypothetical protein